MTRTPDHTSGTQGRPSLHLDGDAALDLLLANTGPGQTVLDLDDDPVLRAAARTTGRRYRTLAVPLRTPGAPGPDRGVGADLVVLAWPRPHAPNPNAGRDALATAAAAVVDGGHVALLLEPTVPQAYTVTWTGAVLAATHAVGLDYLQDVVCLHTAHDPTDTDTDDAGDTVGTAGVRGRQHRVVLVLRADGGRHA